MKCLNLIIFLFCFLLFNSLASHSQTFKGCGAFINSEGDILTTAHIIDNKNKTLLIEDANGLRYTAKILKIDIYNDLALISINQKSNYFAHLRMDENGKDALMPIFDEIVNIIGYQNGVFDPRGALVRDINLRMLKTGYLRVGIGSAYNCSGAPILDNNGLLIGFIADGTKDNSDITQEGYAPPHIFGFDASIFLPFILNAKITIGASNQRDPFELDQFDNLEKINKIKYLGSAFTVKIFSSK